MALILVWAQKNENTQAISELAIIVYVMGNDISSLWVAGQKSKPLGVLFLAQVLKQRVNEDLKAKVFDGKGKEESNCSTGNRQRILLMLKMKLN